MLKYEIYHIPGDFVPMECKMFGLSPEVCPISRIRRKKIKDVWHIDVWRYGRWAYEHFLTTDDFQATIARYNLVAE